AKTLAKWSRVDACIANAGAYPRESLRIDQVDERRFRATVAANLLSSAWTARAFFAALAATGPRADGDGASLVFVGSTAGRFGEPPPSGRDTSAARRSCSLEVWKAVCNGPRARSTRTRCGVAAAPTPPRNMSSHKTVDVPGPGPVN